MAESVFYLFCGLILQAISAAMKATRTKPQPICSDCVFAHRRHTGKGQRAISCRYGGMVRPMNLDVLHCTD